MARHIVLLRGVNVGRHNRLAMAELRDALADAGFEGVRTYLQSGNVLLTSGQRPPQVADECRRLIADRFGLDLAVVVRTPSELARVVRTNPLAGVATDPKRYLVSFLAGKPKREALRALEATAVPPEQVVASGREIYAWLPATVARSKLWALLAGTDFGAPATARNWATVTKLLELATEEE